MLTDALGSALGNIFSAVLLLISVAIYITVIRQVAARRSGIQLGAGANPKSFGWPEAVLAAVLISLLMLNAVDSLTHSAIQLTSSALVANIVLTIVVVLFIAAFLKIRGLDIGSLGGLSKISFLRAISTGLVLL